MVMGKNGSGKSTLLKILSTILPADSGSATVGGYPLKEKRKIRRIISYLPQETLIEDVLTVREIITLQAKLFDVPITTALEITERLGLNELNTLAGELSGGMKKRLCVALALIPDREIYLLDEPFEGVDFSGKLRIKELIEEKIENGRNVILVSHTATGFEDEVDCIVILDQGNLVFSGKPEELRERFSEVAAIRSNSDWGLIRDAVKAGFVVTQIDSVSVVGPNYELKSLTGKYGVKPRKASIGEIYAFCVSKGGWRS
ncbi:MAG: type transport system ATP-binding protein [Archaeoglobus sp.]|nr:type transport system ATP-binding protein [Archaeoglobus sp.]